MSRLVDRIITDLNPFEFMLVEDRDDLGSGYRIDTIEKLYIDADEIPLFLVAQECWPGHHNTTTNPMPKEPFDIGRLIDTPVIAADDVAAYSRTLLGGDMKDFVACMAPPFAKFFVEFQNIDVNETQLYAWGVFVESVGLDEVPDNNPNVDLINGFDEEPRWVLRMSIFCENWKGAPFGPIAVHHIFLAEDGTWSRHEGRTCFWSAPVELTVELPRYITSEFGENTNNLLFPVLLSLTFMNCKNVEVRPSEPPKALSLKHKKKHGHELVRYHVLEVEQIRRILEESRANNNGSLGRALHACRGHFKTFTSDAPLMGKHVGMYWWDPHVRGSKEHGVVLKDYRVSAPREFGRAYRELGENTPNPKKDSSAEDPDIAGRGLAAHNRVQNQVAEILRSNGVEPLSPAKDEPEYDVAWKAGGSFYVCEVKSTTAANEERQLRMAVGQVIRYRQKLGGLGYEPVYALIAVENHPSDSTWEELCKDEGILLIWTDTAEAELRKLMVEE